MSFAFSSRNADARRLVYLERMGIDVWRRRRRAERSLPGAEEALAPQTPEAAMAPRDQPRSTPAPVTFEEELAGCGWEEVRERILNCTRCALHESRTQGVVGVGDPHASLMIIGEAPGAEEDRRGEPFVGRAGKLLDQMLFAIGLARENVYITNILKSRPPQNRDPLPEEVAACEPYLRRQIELISPRVMVAVGRVAAQNLLKTEQPLGRLRGHWHEYGPQRTPLLVTYHPAYLLRKPQDKRKAWQDLRQLRARLAAPAEAEPAS
ncbi:MAG: uracil-DNA glycosylase [Ectothiorhodospiraceae bacterium]|jgi:DNA polymerase